MATTQAPSLAELEERILAGDEVDEQAYAAALATDRLAAVRAKGEQLRQAAEAEEQRRAHRAQVLQDIAAKASTARQAASEADRHLAEAVASWLAVMGEHNRDLADALDAIEEADEDHLGEWDYTPSSNPATRGLGRLEVLGTTWRAIDVTRALDAALDAAVRNSGDQTLVTTWATRPRI